jgi:two-component system sensor histidine kinase BaeS
MARGDYRVRVPAAGEGEIGHLAQSFNVMAQQVQAGNQVLRDFVANVSHDLRTPLTMITGFSQALLDGTAGADEVESSAAIIHEESLKMQRMVNDLLQLTRLESGLLKLQPEPVPAGSFVQGTIDRVHSAYHDRPHARMQFSGDGRLYLLADPIQIERALRNLLENALQYTPSGGEVTVTAQRRAQWIEIAVQDTGMGIAADDLPRVWERFYRSDRARERQSGHSGLGLAIVREIVEAHGGTVTAESEQGKGTTFRLTVPAAAPPAQQPLTEDVPEEAVSR